MRDRASYLLVQDKLRFVLTSPLGPEGEIAEHIHKHGDGVRDMAFWVDDARDGVRGGDRARGARGARSRRSLTDKDGEVSPPRSGPTATRSTRSSSDATIAGSSCRDSSRSTSPYDPPSAGPQVRRPLRRQRRTRQDERLGQVLRGCARLHQHPHVRRQDHQHGVLGADVEGDVERQRPDQVPDQRAGGRQEEVADRGVPRLLPRPRRAAHRHRHRRHRRARCAT